MSSVCDDLRSFVASSTSVDRPLCIVLNLGESDLKRWDFEKKVVLIFEFCMSSDAKTCVSKSKKSVAQPVTHTHSRCLFLAILTQK